MTLLSSQSSDVLTINGESFDFSTIPEGGEIPDEKVPCEFIVGEKVERVEGKIHLTLLLPHAPKASESVRFPKPITVTEDGPITLPGDDNVEA